MDLFKSFLRPNNVSSIILKRAFLNRVSHFQTQPLMSTVCSQVFKQPELQPPNARCQKWFTDAIGHCSKTLMFHVEWSSWTDRFTHMLPSFLRPSTEPELEDSTLYLIDREPFLLNKFECRDLIYRVTQDYLNLAESVKTTIRQNQLVLFAMIALLSFTFSTLVVAKCCRMLMRNNKSTVLKCKVCESNKIIACEEAKMQEQVKELVETIKQTPLCAELEAFLSQWNLHSVMDPSKGLRLNIPNTPGRSDDDDNCSNTTYSLYPPPSKIPVPVTSHAEQKSNQIRPIVMSSTEQDSEQSIESYQSAQNLQTINE